MRTKSAAPSEADRLRFFTSLFETEASLREAAHPRYVLEVGLIKLIEMRSVATIESILERLNGLSGGAPASVRGDRKTPVAVAPDTDTLSAASSGTSAPTSAPVQEKKTLKIEPEPITDQENVEEFVPEPPDDEIGFDETVVEPPLVDPRFSPEWIASVAAPTILPPLP